MSKAPAPVNRAVGEVRQEAKPRSEGVILAVDDSPDSLLILAEILGSQGYDVRPADSGQLALASIEATNPELILLDIRMPGMDGFEVCRRLKATSETRDIPVIFLSAITDTKDRVEGLKLGAVDFISKPFQREELLARIWAHLELSRLRTRLEEKVAERTAHLNAANEQLRMELAERLRAERALRESEERFRSMADNAPVVIWTSGPAGRVDFLNEYGLQLIGCKLEELTGDGWKQFVHPEDVQQRDPANIPTLAAPREYHTEYRLRGADGVYRSVLDTATPRFLSDGSFAGYIGIIVDITDWKQHQEELMGTQKLESLGVLVAGVAHNFNNLMGAIIAEADLALSEVTDDSVRENVERMNSIAIRAADIVSLLTAYANTATAGALTLINVPSIVEETLQLVRATASRNVKFSTKIERRVPAIRADVSQLRQVVMNLLTNACESLPNGAGSVFVGVSCVPASLADSADKTPTPLASNYARICITDTGCGIPDELRLKIFDPFYTTKFLGRGLGLAAVQGIVRRLRGTIKVVSAPGNGSTFEVLIPCIQNDEGDDLK